MTPHKLAGLTEPQWTTLCEIVDGKRLLHLYSTPEDAALIAKNLITRFVDDSAVRATNSGYSLVMDTRRKARDGK